jgi:hypothetical protein
VLDPPSLGVGPQVSTPVISMSDLNPRKYSPADIDTLLAQAPKELLEVALGGLNLMNGMLAGGTAPEPCIETLIDLLRNNAEIRVGKHTFTRPSDIIECMGSNLGMSLAVLAALVTNPHSVLFPASPLAPLSRPRRQEKTPCA